MALSLVSLTIHISTSATIHSASTHSSVLGDSQSPISSIALLELEPAVVSLVFSIKSFFLLFGSTITMATIAAPTRRTCHTTLFRTNQWDDSFSFLLTRIKYDARTHSLL